MEIQHFLGSDKLIHVMLFSMFINVKMPTIVGILTFMSRKNFMLNSVEHETSFYNLGAWLSLYPKSIYQRIVWTYFFFSFTFQLMLPETTGI